jgi:DNA polymerase-1
MPPKQNRPRLFLIDSLGFVFRAYHARARMAVAPMRTTAGLSTEAVFIFHNMLRKLCTAYKPDYIAAIFESGPSFREQEFAEYKANRTEMPDDLREQIPWIRRLLEAMNIPVLENAGFEADDVIGALARRAEADVDVVIVSSDKDMLQLVDDRVSMYNPVKEDVWYDPATTEAFMGVKPTQVADLLALKGDAVDNIPGAPGIGDKGARDLIAQFGSVEAALDRASEVQRKMYRESLENNRERILLSKRLATIDTTVPVEFSLDTLKTREAHVDDLRQVFKELEFFSLARELGPVEDSATRDYVTFENAGALRAWVDGIPADAVVAVSVDSAGEGELPMTTVGLSARPGQGRAFDVSMIGEVRALLEDPSRLKAAHDTRATLAKLAGMGVEGRGFAHDLMLYAFLLCAETSSCSADALAERHLDRKIVRAADQYADATRTLLDKLLPEVEAQGLRETYDRIDLPLAAVLQRMERTGIRIEPAQLAVLSERMDAEMTRLSADIYALAGKPFNINSPQQLGKILFEDLALPTPVKYGKGKNISTAADVLEGLAGDHEIARKVLDYRQLSKLKGTYVDALPALIHPVTKRLHTSFNQIGAATGRLSSSNPNLQNIPIRTELGREIRAAFVPEPGWKLIVADYSQIELRLLAHMSHDPALVAAFRSGEDIHTRTAADVFHVMPELVTPDMRRGAKTVNFGIVYGQTPFGLAAQLGIDRKEAEQLHPAATLKPTRA